MVMNTRNSDSKKKTTFTTPKGELLFSHIVNVDYGTEQYPCKEGRFRVTLCLYPREAEALRNKIANELHVAEEFAREKFHALKPATQKKLGSLRFNEVGEEEFSKEGEPTGRIKFSFKTGAFVERRDGSKVQRKVPLFDSMAQPVTLTTEPGNGTEAKISFTCSPYFVEGTGTGGLTLWLNAVMITKLVKYGERSAADYGFEADEDGAFNAASLTDE
ncbi:MAG: hypothetical protein ACI33N_03640, partial [Desulfovibrionaceae bacterium]